MNERVIFERSVNPQRDSFLGLVEDKALGTDFPINCDSLFVDEQFIYLVSNEIWRINRATRAVDTLPIPVNRSFAFDGERLWYINHKSEVVKYDTHTGQESVVAGIATACFYLTDEELFYTNRLDNGRLYSMNLSTGITSKIVDKDILYFYCDSQYIYFQEKASHTRYRADKSGENVMPFTD
jgi:hypothetical protein